jgi:hypothetical protein
MENNLKRQLRAIYTGGSQRTFYITISLPEKVGDEYVCYVDSEGVLSEISLKTFGVDGLGAMSYALHLIDVLIFERENAFKIEWPDGTEYSRSKIDNYRWS